MTRVYARTAALASLARTLPLTLGVLTLTATVSTAGLLSDPVLHDLRRDGPAISSGQVWRLLTSLLVQDGGVPGTIFNLLGLLAVGALAERRLEGRIWAAAYLAGGLTGELVGWAGWQPIGAGNSVGVCGLAGTLALVIVAGSGEADAREAIVVVAWATALLSGTLTLAAPVAATIVTRVALAARGGRGGRLAVSGFLVAAAAILLAEKDIHGAALSAGAFLGTAAVRTARAEAGA